MSELERLQKELDKLKAELKSLKKTKKFGLVWEEREREKDIDDGEYYPFLVKKGDNFGFDNGSARKNILIEGDNYHALEILQYTHKEKIDVIYIDPPYNTGKKKEFRYGDRWVDENDGYRHSYWLSFMDKRLRLAKELLKKDGVIFISIDDNEQARLKLLCDDVFGEENFRNTIAIRRGAKNVQAQFKTIDRLSYGIEYVLVYTRQQQFRFNKLQIEVEEKDGGWNNHWRGTDRPTMRYSLFGIAPETGQWRWSKKRSMEAIGNYSNMLAELGISNEKVTQEDIDGWYKLLEEQDIDLLRLSKNNKPEHYIPPTDSMLASSNWTDLKPNGSNQLKKLFKTKLFETPKSIDLITRLVSFATQSSRPIILDFFAGSGTTGHAVMQLSDAAREREREREREGERDGRWRGRQNRHSI
jgi:adenine-specific DNA-methyltransferase